ncbi:MAG: ATP-binding cassette domain-containing protein, partial [Streptosporangiaceae bacterium]
MGDAAGRIVVSGLTKRFGRVTAVDGLSFTAAPGVVTGFLGPNGVGKTTTLRMLAGLVGPDAGTATISGHSYAELASPGREAGVVLEAAGFHPARTGREHLRVYCTVCGYPLRRRRRAARRGPRRSRHGRGIPAPHRGRHLPGHAAARPRHRRQAPHLPSGRRRLCAALH